MGEHGMQARGGSGAPQQKRVGKWRAWVVLEGKRYGD